MKFIFLDFDGCLHPSLAREQEYFQRMPLLVECVADLEVGIVVSSSWRFHHDWGDLLGLFPDELRPKVIGKTGAAVSGRHARWHEIGAYVRQHRVTDWRALDDAAFEFPSGCPQLLLCNGATGLTPEVAAVLREWASAPVRP